MSKDYSKGNKDGHEDGRQGDNRLASRSLKRLIKPDQLFPGAGNRHDEYVRGYSIGFEDEVRGLITTTSDTATDTTSHTTGGTAMSGATSIDEQIELLENLKSYLESRQEKLLGLKANYQRKVDALHEEGGLLRDVYESYLNNCLEPTSDMLDSLVDHIGENDIPAVENWIAKLEALRG